MRACYAGLSAKGQTIPLGLRRNRLFDGSLRHFDLFDSWTRLVGCFCFWSCKQRTEICGGRSRTEPGRFGIGLGAGCTARKSDAVMAPAARGGTDKAGYAAVFSFTGMPLSLSKDCSSPA